MEESVVVSAAGRRWFVMEGILTGVIARRRRTLTCNVGGRKERKYFINKRIIYNKTIGERKC
jgi:hypothetical protein